MLTQPHYGLVNTAGLLGRLPISMIGVSLLIALGTAGDLQLGGVLSAVYGLSSAATARWWGGLSDRHGPPRVLLITGSAQCAALVALEVMLPNGPVPNLVAAAVLAGLLQPPFSGIIRARWAALPPGADRRAQSVEAALTESVFVIGPACVTVILLQPVISPLVVCAALVLGGAALLALVDTLAPRPHPGAQRTEKAAMSPALWLLSAVSFSRVLAVTSVEVGLLAAAENAGFTSWSGLLIACLAGGSVLGGIVYGARRWPGSLVNQLIVLLATMSVLALTLSCVANVAGLFLLAPVSGLPSAPIAVIVSLLVAQLVSHQHQASAQSAVAGSAQYLGAAAGFAGGAALADHAGADAAMLMGAAPLIAVALCLAFTRHVLTAKGPR